MGSAIKCATVWLAAAAAARPFHSFAGAKIFNESSARICEFYAQRCIAARLQRFFF